MAYTKIKPVSNHLQRCLDYTANPKKTDPTLLTDVEAVLRYTQNPDKTERQFFVSAFNCTAENALAAMAQTKQRWNKTQAGHVLAYHVIQSFAPGEVSVQKAHEVGCEFARRVLADKYEVTVSTHLDKKHLHNHIVFNSVSFTDGRMYRDDFRGYYEGIRKQSDALCRENGLSIIYPKERGKNYGEWKAEKQGQPTMRSMIRADVDEVLAKSLNWQTFVIGMKKIGYEVRWGPNVKYATVKHIKGSRAVRLKSLGKEYAEDAIRKRFEERAAAPGRQSPPASAKEPEPKAPTAMMMPDWNMQPRRSYGRYRGRLPVKPKIKGFMALYYHYLHLLGRTKKRHSSKRTYFLLREDFQKFDRYLAQSDYIWQHHIEDSAELENSKAGLEQKIAELAAQRNQLYAQKRKAKPETDLSGIHDRIADINAALRSYRKELSLCGSIESDMARLQTQLAEAQQEERAEQLRQEEQHKKEMRFHEQRR